MAHRVKLRCDDIDVIGAVPRDLSVIKNFLKRDCAVKRLIDIEEDLMKRCMAARDEEDAQANEKRASKSGSATAEQPQPDPCASTSPPDPNAADYCDPCRRLKTSVVLEELSKPATFNTAFNPNVPYFDEETVLDSSQPIKFRFRRKANDCDRETRSHLPCVETERTDVMVLINKNDIMVWPSQKVAKMNRVPVTLLSGSGDLTEYMLEEETIM